MVSVFFNINNTLIGKYFMNIFIGYLNLLRCYITIKKFNNVCVLSVVKPIFKDRFCQHRVIITDIVKWSSPLCVTLQHVCIPMF